VVRRIPTQRARTRADKSGRNYYNAEVQTVVFVLPLRRREQGVRVGGNFYLANQEEEAYTHYQQ